MQVIDVGSSTLQNVITFPPDGAFIVNSGISVAGPQRVDFKFKAAALNVNGRKIPFPPFGQGWCAPPTPPLGYISHSYQSAHVWQVAVISAQHRHAITAQHSVPVGQCHGPVFSHGHACGRAIRTCGGIPTVAHT